MPKAKTHSATKKRVKVTGSGLFKIKRTGMAHNLRKKTTKQKRHLNVDAIVTPGDDNAIRHALHLPNPRRKAAYKPATTEA